MVNINFEKLGLNTSKLAYPIFSGYAKDNDLLFGLWDGKSLVKVVSLGNAEFEKIDQFFNATQFKSKHLVYQSDIFEHVDFESFEPHLISSYFKNYSAAELDSVDLRYEKLKQQKIFTLSGENQNIKQSSALFDQEVNLHHLSTGMANLLLDQNDQILIMISDHQLDLAVQKDKSFFQYDQFEASTANDFLYYIILTIQKLGIQLTDIPILIGGNIDISSSLYKLLKSYLPQMELFRHSNYKVNGTDQPFHYYLPLMIARACA